MSNELTTTTTPKFAPGAVGAKAATGLAARKQQAQQVALATGKSIEKSPNEMLHRIGIIFDDSGSMNGEAINDAKAGTEEFLRYCERDNTAVSVHTMTMQQLSLTSNLPAIAIWCSGLNAEAGSTPIIEQLTKMFRNENLTRAIVFSDGAPDSSHITDGILRKGIAVDTVYIPKHAVSQTAVNFMKELAEKTGGIYLQFERGKSNFRTAFKYLSPGLRYMLTDGAFKDKLEGK